MLTPITFYFVISPWRASNKVVLKSRRRVAEIPTTYDARYSRHVLPSTYACSEAMHNTPTLTPIQLYLAAGGPDRATCTCPHQSGHAPPPGPVHAESPCNASWHIACKEAPGEAGACGGPFTWLASSPFTAHSVLAQKSLRQRQEAQRSGTVTIAPPFYVIVPCSLSVHPVV